ncbi:hypothetical protein KIN20_002070 [Parelaphostrongylus tenuis]|uniref:Suppressor of forked domain-containing protein n=1 Tax=Parelaphostrongylus tenuis TaxID=148309 RepID=A0AAD5QF28_PARTN|nr:hypothetical protein KIN20_002064 [Parelaphostrongylus tenuis]KAJ1347109.1 hypothetical protein KIN20_002070 [Parelaphostrongylus tenuis]
MIAVHMTRILYFVLLFVALSNAASDESTDDQVMASSSILTPERRIELNPFDIDAWNLILRESQARPIDQARNFYEKLVTQFPNAGRYGRLTSNTSWLASCGCSCHPDFPITDAATSSFVSFCSPLPSLE